MIHAVIMASGFSRRMGEEKLLLDLGGKPVIRWVIEAARASGADCVTLVYRNPLVAAVAESCGISVLFNPDAAEGQSAGIRLALAHLSPQEACLFLAGDQPLISAASLQQILGAYRQHKPEIVSACWGGQGVLPVLFSPSMHTALQELSGDRGARALIASGRYSVMYQPLGGEEEQWDIDTPEAFNTVAKWVNAGIRMDK